MLVLLGGVPSPGFGEPAGQARLLAETRTATGVTGTLPDVVLVGFRDASAARLGLTLRAHGLASADLTLRAHRLGRLRVPKGRARDDVIAELKADPNVAYAEPVLLRQLAAYVPPDDPAYSDPTTWTKGPSTSPYGKSWWLRDTGVNAPAAWAHGFSDPAARDFPMRAAAGSFKVGVIDTGFYLTHPDRGANIVAGHDFFDHYYNGVFYEDDDVSPPPDTAKWWNGYSWVTDIVSDSHGTCTAGQIAAATHNATGVASVGYDDQAVVYKVAGVFTTPNPYGYPANGVGITSEALTAAIYRAADDGCRVISISLGGDVASAAEQTAVDYAWGKGCVVVAASGNSGASTGVMYPARYGHVVGVGSGGVNAGARFRSSFSNYGTGLDITAPGEMVWGLLHPSYYTSDGGTANAGYMFWQGTSMATPAAAGAIAHLWRYVPALTNDQVVDLVQRTAVPAGSGQPNSDYGWGYLDMSSTIASVTATYPYLGAPVLHLPATPSPGDYTVAWDAVPGHSVVYEVSLDGSLVSTTTATGTVLTINDGSHGIRVQATSVYDYYDALSATSDTATVPAPPGWAAFQPQGWCATLTPAVSIETRDATTGLAPGTAEVRCTSDGGTTWSGWAVAALTGSPGSTATETISATATFTADSDSADRVQFRVTNGGSRIATSSIFTVRVDSTPPTGTLTLASGASTVSTTTVPVISAVTDAHAIQMQLSADGGVTWTGWGPYTSAASVTIPAADGSYTVKARYRDIAGNVLELSRPIVLQLPTPTYRWAAFQPESWSATLTPSVSVQARDVTSGLAATGAEFRCTSNGGATWSGWAAAALTGSPGSTATETISATASFAGDSDTADRVQFRVTNGAGLVGTSPVFTVRVDSTPPAGTLTVPAEVTLRSVAVTSAVTDAHAIEMRLSGDGGVTWPGWGPYSAQATVTLAAGRGTKTVAAQYRDVAGNVLTLTRQVYLAVPPRISRLEGPNRYDTAIRISRERFAHAATIVVATGTGFADALSASALAGSYGAPLLLTPPSALYPSLPAEVARLGATRAIVVGSDSAVSAAVYEQLDLLPGMSVERVWGADRYGTSAAIAAAVVAHERSLGRVVPAEYFVARGDDFADALAASPFAYHRRMPIVLTRTSSLPADTWRAIRTVDPSKLGTAVIAGGPAAVGGAVTAALSADGRKWERVAGDDRYGTAGALVDQATGRGWADWHLVGIATGANFPDALGGGAATGAGGGVMLLTPAAGLAPQASTRIAARARDVTAIDLFGGTPALSAEVMTEVGRLF
jgi:putative cell wall-binding protein